MKDIEEGFSYGYNNVRDSVTLTPRRQVEPLLLPDQLMNLERLSGYIKFPDGFPAAKIALRYVDYPARAEGFVPIQPAGSAPTDDDDVRDEGRDAMRLPVPIATPREPTIRAPANRRSAN